MAPSDWLSSLHVGVTRKQDLNFSRVQKRVTEVTHFKKAQMEVSLCDCVYLSYAAARSTIVEISCKALSVKVEMASRIHSLMSVTT